MTGLTERYASLIHQANWYAANGFIRAAAETELNAKMVLACMIDAAKGEARMPNG